MKAILLLDEMPRNCVECPLMQDIVDSGFYGVCMPTLKDDVYLYNEDRGETRPNWCPLKPLPQKKNEKDVEKIHKTNDRSWTNGFADGFNFCIDEILGDKQCKE